MGLKSENVNVENINTRDTRDSLDSLGRKSNNSEPGAEGRHAPCEGAKYILSGTRDPADGLFPHYDILCKSYGCWYCGPIKAYLVGRGIKLAVPRFGLKAFATLTLDPKTCGCGPDGSVEKIREIWNKYRIVSKREEGRNIEFIAVVEFQKSGFAHLHVLFDQFIDQATLKKQWNGLGGGSIVHIREADENAARYMAKYLVKSLNAYDGKKRFRRYSTSQGISLTRLLREARAESEIKFRFCKVNGDEAREILEPYIRSDITDRHGFVTGFRADRQLNPKPTDGDSPEAAA